MWRVDLGLIEDWLDSLDDRSVEQVVAAIEVLAERGPNLGRPLVVVTQHERTPTGVIGT